MESYQTTQNLVNSHTYSSYYPNDSYIDEDCEFSAIKEEIASFASNMNDCEFDNTNLNIYCNSDSDSHYTGSRPSSTQLNENEFNNYYNMDLCNDTTYLLSLPNSNDWTLASSRKRHVTLCPASPNFNDSRSSPIMSDVSFYEDIQTPPAYHAPENGRRTPPPPYRPPVNNVDISGENAFLETTTLKKIKPPPPYTETVRNSAAKCGIISELSGFTANTGVSQNSQLTANRTQSAVSASRDWERLPKKIEVQAVGFRDQRAAGEDASTEVLVPADPELWDKDHIDLWLTKVENYYGLQHIDRTNMPGDGRSLCRLSAEEFQQITGDRRTADILSNYLDCVRQNIKFSSPSSLENTDGNEKKKSFFEAVKQVIGKTPKDKSSSPSGGGQIQLWQFLLELLFDPKYSSFIGWQDDNGTFRFFDPEGTARLWGERKFREEKSKKPMNYDKLSRSLRHYYMKGIIIKVSGQKYTYKFIADGVLRACAPSGMSDSQFIYANIDPSTCDENSPRNYHLDFTITC